MERIKVFGRIRPSQEERAHKVVHAANNDVIIKDGEKMRKFSFDGVFGEESTQEAVFDIAASRIVQGSLQGYNGTIFAYGQTGSGKSYSMMGPPSKYSQSSSNIFDEESGIIPRGLKLLFELLDKKKEEMPNVFSFNVCVSFIEIHNENIYDLFVKSEEKLNIGQDHEGNSIVKGTTEIIVEDFSNAMKAVKFGWANRTWAETSMNRSSSRSHALLLIKIRTEEVHGSISTVRSAFLNLVDLAGSERLNESNSEGNMMRETTSINGSLHHLKNVIRDLSEKKSKRRFINFRNSELTHILKNSLGGNSRTAVMITLHPDKEHYSETLSSLVFSADVKTIENRVLVNEDLKGDSVAAFEEEINRLNCEIEKIKSENSEGVAQLQHTLEKWKKAANKFGRNSRLHNSNAMHSDQVRDLNDQLDLLRFEKEELQIHLDEEKRTKRELGLLQYEKDKLQFELNHEREAKLELEEKLKNALEVSGAEKRRADMLAVEMGKAEKKIGENRKEEVDMNAEIDRLNAEIKLKNVELTNKENEKTSAVEEAASLRDELRATEEKLDSISSEMKKFQQEIADKEKKMEEGRKKSEEDHKENISALERELEKMKVNNEEERRKNEENERESASEVARLREEKDALTASNDKMKIIIDKKEKSIQLAIKSQSEAEYQMIIHKECEQAAQNQVDNLNSEIALMKSNHSDKLRSIETELKSHLSDKEKKECDMKSEIDQLKEGSYILKAELEKKKNEMQSLDEIISTYKSKLVTSEKEKNEKAHELDSARSQIDYLIQAMENHEAELHEQISELTSRVNEYEEREKKAAEEMQLPGDLSVNGEEKREEEEEESEGEEQSEEEGESMVKFELISPVGGKPVMFTMVRGEQNQEIPQGLMLHLTALFDLCLRIKNSFEKNAKTNDCMSLPWNDVRMCPELVKKLNKCTADVVALKRDSTRGFSACEWFNPATRCSSIQLEQIDKFCLDRVARTSTVKEVTYMYDGNALPSMESIREIVLALKMDKKDLFVHLGSRAGNVVLFASAYSKASKCIGIEGRDDCARMASKLKKEFENDLSWYGKTHRPISLLRGDFLHEHRKLIFEEATVLYIDRIIHYPHYLLIIFFNQLFNETNHRSIRVAFCKPKCSSGDKHFLKQLMDMQLHVEQLDALDATPHVCWILTKANAGKRE